MGLRQPSNHDTDSEPDSGGETTEAKAAPLSNDLGVIGLTEDNTRAREQEVTHEALFERIKKSPEVISIMSTLADDILSYGIDIEYVGRDDTPGTRKVAQAREFINSGFKQELEAMLLDMFSVGDGYMYKYKITPDVAKSRAEEIVDEHYEFNYAKNELLAKRMLSNHLVAKARDEDMFRTKGVQQVPASTMEHEIDEHGNIIRFHQEVDQREQNFDPDKIIHVPMMRFDGHTYGYSPVQSIISEIDILANIKDTHGVFFSNAAVANKIWTLKDEGPESNNYKVLKETLKKYRRLRDKHKDIVVTGDVEVDDLSSISDSMEFRELAEYISKVIVMAWGMPPSRIGVDVSSGGNSNPSRSASMSNEGYFKRISRFQDKISTIFNQELFEPEFDVKITFRDPDIRTEIKKADREMRKTEVAKQRLAMGLWNKKRALEYLGIQDFEAADIDEDELRDAARGADSSQNNMLDDTTINSDAGDEGDNQEKRIAETE